MNWTRTSYLFLVLILISVGVTSAYAITITLGADPVNILGDLNVDGDIDVSGPLTNDDDSICFDDGSQCLRWRDSLSHFQIQELFINGGLEAEGTIAGSTLNSFGNTIVGGDLDLTGTSATDDDTIFFDDGTFRTLKWDDSENQFEFSDRLQVQGSLDIFEGSITASGPGSLTINGLLNLGTPDTRTIASGAVNVFDTLLNIAAETGTADDLDTVNGGTTGDLLILTADTGDTITVTNNGNFLLDGFNDIILDNNDRAGFIFDGTFWNELFHSNLG